MEHVISVSWLPNPNGGRSHFLHGFWSSYECLMILIKGPKYGVSELGLLLHIRD